MRSSEQRRKAWADAAEAIVAGARAASLAASEVASTEALAADVACSELALEIALEIAEMRRQLAIASLASAEAL